MPRASPTRTSWTCTYPGTRAGGCRWSSGAPAPRGWATTATRGARCWPSAAPRTGSPWPPPRSVPAPRPPSPPRCTTARRPCAGCAPAHGATTDPDRFAAMGNSSGGWLAAMLGVSGGVGPPGGRPRPRDWSSRVQACPGGGARQPRHLRQPRRPAFLILHGTGDPLVPLRQSEMLFRALRRACAEVRLTSPQGRGHEHGYLDETAPPFTPRSARASRGCGPVRTLTGPPATWDALVRYPTRALAGQAA
jgi:hypothetical protein